MAYPVVKYNSASGSNTAPSDSIADSGDSGNLIDASSGSNTLTFDSAVNLTGVADDDSDYIWVSSNSNRRHLYQITAFNPNVGACTSLTVAESVDASMTNSNWHVNGTRASLDGDTGYTDWQGLDPGWVVELDGTFVQTGTGVRVADNRSTSSAVTDLPVTIRASASASSKPTIDIRSSGYQHFIASAFDDTHVRFEGLNLFCTTGGGAFSQCNAITGQLTLEDCNIDTSGGSATVAITAQYTGRALRIFNCYIKGGTTHSVYADNITSLTMSNCWIDGQDTYGSTSLIMAEGFNTVIESTLLTESTGDGLQFSLANNRDALLWVTNCTSADNAGDGFSVSGTHTDSASAMAINFINCISANNGAYGWSCPTASTFARSAGTFDYNCGFNNTSGNYDGTTAGSNDITISADPFTDASSDDYTLNSAASGGALLKAAAKSSLPTRPT